MKRIGNHRDGDFSDVGRLSLLVEVIEFHIVLVYALTNRISSQ